MLPSDDAYSLPLLYHLNSEPWLNVEAYTDQQYEVRHKSMEGIGQPVELPLPQGESPLLELFRARRSCREFLHQTMPLSVVGMLLGGAYGLMRESELPGGMPIRLRAAPSAGGLYPLELYVMAQRVEGLEQGLHHYNAVSHRLEFLRGGVGPDDAWQHLLGQTFTKNANLVIFFAAVFERTLKKYGARGYRYVLFEAGHVAQDLCLMAAGQKLGALCMGGFVDSRLNRFLGLDGTREAALYSVTVGYPGVG